MTDESWNPPKERRCNVIRSRKYFAVVCKERWGGSYHSRTGWSAWIPRKEGNASWLGANMRKALLSSEDFTTRYGHPIRRDISGPAKIEMGMAEFRFWSDVVEKLKFKDKKAAQSKSALLFCSWNYEETDQILLKATKGFGTGHSAWYTHENEGRVFHATLALSDEELGQVAIAALDRCVPNYL